MKNVLDYLDDYKFLIRIKQVGIELNINIRIQWKIIYFVGDMSSLF